MIKPHNIIFISVFLLLLLFLGFLAISQEDEDDFTDLEFVPDLEPGDLAEDDEPEEEMIPVWMPPGPPRWYRSNAGGMALEEIDSRLAALRNRYALVIDYVSPDEIESVLKPFFDDEFTVEIRVLFEHGEETHRQWLFRDDAENTRLNAVFRNIETTAEEPAENTDENTDEEADDALVDINSGAVNIAGFVEIYNKSAQITEDYLFTDDGWEILTVYSYNEKLLVNSETKKKFSGDEDGYLTMYTDSYRYNRAFSLRHVERYYSEKTDMNPVRLLFPYRVFDAAADSSFMSDKLSPGSDFLETFSALAGYRMVYDTDARGRILSQKMLNEKDETIWVMENTWSGDRITATMKTEGDEERLTEYTYDSDGKRIVQRDIRNGVLERLVRIDGDRETEELYMNGIVVLRAFWENGRKISEERVRQR